MPPRTNPTPYNQATTHYDEIQGLREDSYRLNQLFDQHDNLRREITVRGLGVLPSAATLAEAEVKATRNSAFAKDLETVHKKQADQLRALGDDLANWKDRVRESGAFPHNELARGLVQVSITAAIDLLIEHQKHLTTTNRGNLAALNITSIAPDPQFQLLTRESLMPEYSEVEVNRLLKGEDGLTAMRVWQILFDEMENNQDAWAKEKASLEKEVQDTKRKLSTEQTKVDARDAELEAAEGQVSDFVKRASAAETSLASFKQTLGLDATADDLAVQGELSTWRTHKATIVSARTKLTVPQSDGDILTAIDALHDELEAARATIANDSPAILKSVREILDLPPHRDVCEYLEEMKKRSDKHASIVKGAKKQLDLAPSDSNVVGAVAHWMERAKDAEPIVSRARKLLEVESTDGDIPSAIRSLKNKLSKAEGDRDLVKKALALTSDVELETAINDTKRRLDTAEGNVESMIGSVRKLLAPSEAPTPHTIASIVLARHNATTTKLRDQGSVLDLPAWSLEITSVSVSVDGFQKRMERLKVLTVFDADVSTCLKELEGMIAQVEQCTHDDLAAVLTMLHAYWQTTGLVKMVNGQPSVVPAAIPQSSLHVLFEARLLELMVRGTSVLRCGWVDVQEAVHDIWMVVNRTAIEKNAILQAYRAWFSNLNQPIPLSLPRMLYDIVLSSDPALSCQEASGARVLVANVLSNDYCLLWQIGEHRASMYAVSDLQHYLGTSTTVFPGRRRAPGVVVTDPEFTEPLFARFVMEAMTSLHLRGLTGRRQV